MTRVSRSYMLELAGRLNEYQERGVFTANHRWELVGEAADALRAIVSEDAIQDSMKEVLRQKIAFALAEKAENRPSDGTVKFFLPYADAVLSALAPAPQSHKASEESHD